MATSIDNKFGKNLNEDTDKKDIKEELLLEPYYDQYYAPLNWEFGKKSRNFIAKIKPGKKTPFRREFLKTFLLDDQPVFLLKDFKDGEIIEQKCVYIKGSKQEATFHGFFVVSIREDGIWGEPISQKETLQLFACEALESTQIDKKRKKLKMRIEQTLQRWKEEYGANFVSEILMETILETLPNTPSK